jgi:hypothetical protein
LALTPTSATVTITATAAITRAHRPHRCHGMPKGVRLGSGDMGSNRMTQMVARLRLAGWPKARKSARHAAGTFPVLPHMAHRRLDCLANANANSLWWLALADPTGVITTFQIHGSRTDS